MLNRTLTAEYRYFSFIYFFDKAYFGVAEKES